MFRESGIDLGYLIKKIKRNWLFIGFFMGLFLVLGFIYIQLQPNRYKISSSIKINEEESGVTVADFFEGVQLVEEKTNIANETAVLKSYNLVNETLRSLGRHVSYLQKGRLRKFERYGELPFRIRLDTTINPIVDLPIKVVFLNETDYELTIKGEKVPRYNYQTNKMMRHPIEEVNIKRTMRVGETFENPYLKFRLIPGDYAPKLNEAYFFVVNDFDRLTEEYRKKLKISPINRESSILEIRMVSATVEKQIDFMEELIKLYILKNFDRQNQIAGNTIDFIDRQLMIITDSLQNAEYQLQQFRKYNKVMDLSYQSRNAYDELDKLKGEKSDQEIRARYYSYLSDYVKQSNELDDILAPSMMGIEDPTLTRSINKLSELNAEKTALDFNVNEKNPRIAILNENIEQVKREIIEKVNSINKNVEFSLENLEKQIQEIEQRISRLPETERILQSAQRNFEFNDNIYNYLLQKRAEIAIVRESAVPTDVIIDPPQVEGNKPVSPNKKVILGFSLILGFIFPIGLILVRDMFTTSIQHPEELEGITGLSIFGEIPHLRGYKLKDTLKTGVNNGFEFFRSLRIKIENLSSNRIIGVCSLGNGDGKTFVAFNLAKAFALAGKKTLLIDADLNSPDLNTILDLSDKSIGLKDFILDKSMSHENTFKTPIENLHVILGSNGLAGGQDIIRSDAFASLFAKLTVEYDYIILDNSPLQNSSNYLAYQQLTDLTLFVVRQNHTSVDFRLYREMLEGQEEQSNVHLILNDLK